MDETTTTELDLLLGRLCDGALTSGEAEQLERLLREEGAQRRYAEYMLLHQALRAQLSPGGSLPAGIASAASLTAAAAAAGPGTRRRWRRWGLAGAGAALAVAVAAAVLIWFTGEPDEPRGVAVVTRTAAARWSGASPAVGAPLSPGPLVLASGLAQVDLYSGATLVLEGPAAIDLLDERSARFHHGRIRSRVPKPAQGLRISLPGGEVVDLGTEFGLDVQRGGAGEIHVFDGAVDWHRDGAVTRLGKGQALRLDRRGDRPIVADDRAFADPQRLVATAALDVEQRRRAWTVERDKLQRDPALLLYFDFQETGGWGQSLRNRAAAAWQAPDGAIVGGRWVAGRFPDTRALEFKRPSDRVLVNIPGQHRAFSIAAWVRFDGLDNRYNALVHTDGWSEGSVHAHITHDGRIALALRNRERVMSSTRIGRAHLGRWIHLAWVWEGPGGHASFYRDGRLDGSTPIASRGEVSLGSAQIGNWDREHRNLNGQIDEILILGRPLAAREIAAMAATGPP